MTRKEEIYTAPSWRRNPFYMASTPARNLAGNIRNNPGHQDGQPYVGLAGVGGGTGKRDILLGNILAIAAASGNPKLAFKLFQAISAISSSSNIFDSIGNSVAMKRVVSGKASLGDYDRAINLVNKFSEKEKRPIQSALSGAVHEAGVADQSKISGKIGMVQDAVQGVTGYKNESYLNALIGSKDKVSASKYAVESISGIIPRVVDMIPGVNKFIPTGGVSDALAGYSGGAAQSYINRNMSISREKASLGASEIERRRLLYLKQLEENRRRYMMLSPIVKGNAFSREEWIK